MCGVNSRNCEPIASHRWDVMHREFECSITHCSSKIGMQSPPNLVGRDNSFLSTSFTWTPPVIEGIKSWVMTWSIFLRCADMSGIVRMMNVSLCRNPEIKHGVSCLSISFANLWKQVEFIAEVVDLFHDVFVSKLCWADCSSKMALSFCCNFSFYCSEGLLRRCQVFWFHNQHAFAWLWIVSKFGAK